MSDKPEAVWYISRGDQQFGPIPVSELELLAKSGRLAPSDLLWTEGFAEWQPASAVVRLSTPPPPPPQPPKQPSFAETPQRQNPEPRASDARQRQEVTHTVIEGGSFKFGTFILIVLGLVVPLWPITLPICWYLAYRSYKKPSTQTVRVVTRN